MTDFETELRQRLSADDEAFLKNLENGRGLFSQMGAAFDGPMRFWMAIAMIITFIATGIGLFAVWQMFAAESTRGLILWAAGGWAAWTMQIALKQWMWNRMNMLTILREVKRLELRLATIEAASRDGVPSV